ncbi:MAG: bifunctional adenosylcobinamide kinase/adenosylcobinamide-phosphate guanylyltransferase [Phormidesmis sp.]
MAITLVTGPARSGKSEWAEQLAQRCAIKTGRQVVYIATANASADDSEWQGRIAQHQQRRPPEWRCQEVPVELAMEIAPFTLAHCLLIYSLGTWLANLIEQEDTVWKIVQQQLIAALSATDADVILVAEETGWGIVPAYELGRRFRDRLGALSQLVGEIATDVYLVTSGYAINLSTLGQPISH